MGIIDKMRDELIEECEKVFQEIGICLASIETISLLLDDTKHSLISPSVGQITSFFCSLHILLQRVSFLFLFPLSFHPFLFDEEKGKRNREKEIEREEKRGKERGREGKRGKEREREGKRGKVTVLFGKGGFETSDEISQRDERKFDDGIQSFTRIDEF